MTVEEKIFKIVMKASWDVNAITADDLTGDILDIIKELVAEAKPEVKAHPLGPVTLADCQRGLDHYEANLLKALEEV